VQACRHAGVLMFARVPTPSSPVREIERAREKERESGRGRKIERCRIWLLNLKRMTGALAPFSHLVVYYCRILLTAVGFCTRLYNLSTLCVEYCLILVQTLSIFIKNLFMIGSF
jgi:hypothetical protein